MIRRATRRLTRPWWAFWRPRVWTLSFTPPIAVPARSMLDVKISAPPPYGPREFDLEVPDPRPLDPESLT